MRVCMCVCVHVYVRACVPACVHVCECLCVLCVSCGISMKMLRAGCRLTNEMNICFPYLRNTAIYGTTVDLEIFLL